MSVTQKLVTTNFNVESATSFVDSFANNDYFVFAGKHTPYPGSDAILTTPVDSLKSTNLDVYDNMIFAKRVTSSDVMHVIPKYLWAANTFYYKYDHTDGDLYSKSFYAVVDDSTEYNVYKCLYNNSNTTVFVNSTIAPTGKSLNHFKTGDDYIWKYMYSITKTQYEKFASTNYVPVIANTTVQAAAVPGSVELVDIVIPGKGYNNYISSGVFRTTDLKVGGIGTIYGAPDDAVAEDDYYAGCVIKITNSSVGAANQYRRIVDYRGVGGQKIFILNEAFATAPAASDTYEVYPYVYIWGDGTETTPAEGMAIIDSASSNSIIEIEMLSVGVGYRYGESYAGETPNIVPITINSVFIQLPVSVSGVSTFQEATLQPIISPIAGHGSDPLSEFGAKRVCISTKFTNSESGRIPTENDFRQVGLIKNPLYTNVDLILRTASTIGGSFQIGETVHQFKQLKLHGNVSITAASNVITKTDWGRVSSTVTIANGGSAYANSSTVSVFANSVGTGGSGFAATATVTANVVTAITVTNQGNNYVSLPVLQINTTATGSGAQILASFANPQTPLFKDSFLIGDRVLVTKGSNNFLSTVSSIPYDYQIVAANNSAFTASDCDISALVLQASGKVTSVSVGQITLSNVAGVFTEESRIIGLTSNVTTVIETTAIAGQASIQVNDKAAGAFTTAVQLTRLTGDFPGGGTNFISDEVIQQTGLISYAQARGAFHSIILGGGSNDDTMYISNKFSIYNLDPIDVRPITGVSSGAVLRSLNSKYPGDFVVGSGQVLYIENLDPITRADNKSEIIKIILEF
jgi:hypothetical protein